MKRLLKYSLIIITVVSVIGLIFYLIKKPGQSIINHIPADVSYCFTINNQQIFKEALWLDDFKKDSFLQKIKSKIPINAIQIFEEIGINTLGEFAVFGETNDEVNVAWIGMDKKKLTSFIKKNKWPQKHYKTYNQVKITNQLYLNYKWPMVILSNKNKDEKFDFFNPKIKKLNKNSLQHTKTQNCLIYGFIIPNGNLLINYPFLQKDEPAFIGLKKMNKKLEIYFIQRTIKLRGKLGLPQKLPESMAFLSWPIDSGSIPIINSIPSIVYIQLHKLITKPINHLYAEVLDTTSTYQEIIQYDMNDEFQLTQKIFYQYKTYPGLRLEFVKSKMDSAKNNKPTNLGLEILKLHYHETYSEYIIASQNKSPLISTLQMPDYFIYANFEKLRTDPFWGAYAPPAYKTLQIHAEPWDKGSIFVFTLTKK